MTNKVISFFLDRKNMLFGFGLFGSVTTHQAYLESMTWSVKRLLLASIWTAGLTLTRYFVQMEGVRPNDPVRHSIVLGDVWKGYFWLGCYCLSLVWASDWNMKNGLDYYLAMHTMEKTILGKQMRQQTLKLLYHFLTRFLLRFLSCGQRNPRMVIQFVKETRTWRNVFLCFQVQKKNWGNEEREGCFIDKSFSSP